MAFTKISEMIKMVKKNVGAIVTIPPYASFVKEIVRHPSVEGLRLNTVMPVNSKDTLEDVLKRLNDETSMFGKELWIDLKCRQLRVDGYFVPPFTEIKLSHNIKVNTPVKAYFSDGRETATVVSIDGNKLIMLEGPKRVVGPGESVNIVDPSLSVEGYLTDKDKEYIDASLKAGVKNYMLSFVEYGTDIEGFRKYNAALLGNDVKVVAKIESVKGMNYINKEWSKDSKVRLMAARGDLYVELDKPHYITAAVENIVMKDENAIVASRIFPSLSESLEPTCTDIGDVDNLLRMGYRTVMFGDDICMKRDSIVSGLNLLKAMSERYAVK